MATPLATISLDHRKLYYLQEMLSPKQAGQAEYQALARTGRNLATSINRVLREETAIRRDVAGEMVTSDISREGGSLVSRVIISGRGIPIRGYRYRASKRRGVSFRPTTDGASLEFKHAFEATMKSGHASAFQRRKLAVFGPGTTQADLVTAGFPEDEARELLSRGARLSKFYGKGIRHQKRIAAGGNFPNVTPRGIAWRLPIEELRGPTAAAIVGRRVRLDPILATAGELLEKNYLNQLARFADAPPRGN